MWTLSGVDDPIPNGSPVGEILEGMAPVDIAEQSEHVVSEKLLQTWR